MKTKSTGQTVTPARECPYCRQWVWLPNYGTHIAYRCDAAIASQAAIPDAGEGKS